MDVKTTPDQAVRVEETHLLTLPLMQGLDQLGLPGFNENLFASKDWLKVVDQTYGCALFIKYLERNGRVSSYIIYSVVKNFLEWKICICSYSDYFDCHIERREDWQTFFDDLRREYPDYRITIRNLRDEQARDCGLFQVLSKERFHILDVREPLEKVWKKTHDSFRSAVKQSQKLGVTVRPCTKDELKLFFKMHLDLRRAKYRLFPQPYRFFEIIWDQYIENGRGVLLGAFDPQGQMIAANMYLICGDTLYYKFNTSSLSSLKFRPNNQLFWEGIKFAKDKNLNYIDLGSSGYDQKGLILFKNHTGAACHDIIHLGYAPPDYQFSQKRILKIFTRTCTARWLPDWVVRLGSHLIYPYLA